MTLFLTRPNNEFIKLYISFAGEKGDKSQNTQNELWSLKTVLRTAYYAGKKSVHVQ